MTRTGNGPAWLAATLWVLSGIELALGISEIGLFTVPVALVTVVLLATVGARWALAGLVACASAVALFVGRVGWTSSSSTACSVLPDGTGSCTTTDSVRNPWPWYAASLVLVLGAVSLGVVAARARRRGQTGRAPRPRAVEDDPGRVLVAVAPLFLAGAGLVPIYIAWLNRDGPGDVCLANADGACTEQMQEWSPWPWLGVGLALVVTGVVLFVVLRRRTAERRQPVAGSTLAE